jgi:hypothetical protein
MRLLLFGASTGVWLHKYPPMHSGRFVHATGLCTPRVAIRMNSSC